MAGVNVHRVKGLVESLIRKYSILRSDTHGWAEDGTWEVLEISEESVRIQCSYPDYKLLSEGMGPLRFQKGFLEPAFSIAAQIIRLLFYNLSEVNFSTVRVDIYASFRLTEDKSVERCILTTTAARQDADKILWPNMSPNPQRILSYFQTRYNLGPNGEIYPIQLDDELYIPRRPDIPILHWHF